jgi:hypothetical protein
MPVIYIYIYIYVYIYINACFFLVRQTKARLRHNACTNDVAESFEQY